MSTDDAFYQWGKLEPLSVENLTKRPLDLHLRLKSVEALKIAYETVLGDVEDKVLAQTENVLAGLRAQLAAIVELGWLTAVSATSITLVASEERGIIIAPADRQLFAPGPFAVLSLNTDPNVYAIVQTLDYDRDVTGQYDFTILTQVGGPGPFADWSVSAVAGSTLGQMMLLSQGQDTLATTIATAASAHTDRTAADADAAATAADRAAINSKLIVSASPPSGGNDGDIWFMV